MSKDVRRDKRFRPDGSGGTVFRSVATWEEAHEVVKELEETAVGQRALNNSTFAHGSGRDRPTKTKKADKIHAQDDVHGERLEKDLKKVCFDMRDRGTCSRGKECKYVHDAVIEEAQETCRGTKSLHSKTRTKWRRRTTWLSTTDGKGPGKKMVRAKARGPKGKDRATAQESLAASSTQYRRMP